MAKWWLISWTTYGTWLPGDPRGFRTWRGERHVLPPKRYAKPGEPTYRAEEYAAEHRLSQAALVGESVHLTEDQRRAALNAIVTEIATINIVPAVLAIGCDHTHLLAQFGTLLIRPTIGRLKGAATRCLHDNGLDSERVWSRCCHMKSKTTPGEVQTAFRYVERHRNEDAAVYVWHNDFGR